MKNPYQVVRDFEENMAEYTGAPYAISVDSCTNAIFLCCKYLGVGEVEIPKHTYLSVPCSIINAGGKVKFRDGDWYGQYRLNPYPIWDSACYLSRKMYNGEFQCLSFSANKLLPVGKGGMILTDNEEAMKWFKLARYEGRNETSYLTDQPKMVGWNMYMTPEQAARGLVLLSYLPNYNLKKFKYPDLSLYGIYE